MKCAFDSGPGSQQNQILKKRISFIKNGEMSRVATPMATNCKFRDLKSRKSLMGPVEIGTQSVEPARAVDLNMMPDQP
jgi:hypothetical protein